MVSLPLLGLCLGFAIDASAAEATATVAAQAVGVDPGGVPSDEVGPGGEVRGTDSSEATDAVGRAVGEVTDPMLESLEPPARVLSTWQEALRLVRSRSTTVATAQARIVEANARARQTLSQNLPSVSAQGSVQRSLLFGTGLNFQRSGVSLNARVPFPPTLWNASVSLRQPLVNLRGWHDVSTADVAERAATVSAEDAERLALGALADTIVTVITAERLAEVSRVSLRSNLSTLDLTRRRARLGAASAVDVLRAEQEVTSNRLDVVQTREALRLAREALGMALGFAEGWGVSSEIKLDQLGADARSVCSPISDPNQRSDVRAAELSLQVTERNQRSPNYGYAPSLDLVSSFQYTTQAQAARPVSWSVGAVLSVPIFDGGFLAGESDVNRASREIAQQQLTEVQRRAQLEVVQSQRSVSVAEANFEVSQNARDIAKESARLSRIAFIHGTGTSFDLVESARRHRLSEIDVTIREFEVVRARITAFLALSNCDI